MGAAHSTMRSGENFGMRHLGGRTRFGSLLLRLLALFLALLLLSVLRLWEFLRCTFGWIWARVATRGELHARCRWCSILPIVESHQLHKR